MDRYWLVVAFALLIVLVALRSKRSGRSALYAGALKLQYGICLAAAVLPAIATVIEELPERFQKAWLKERGDSRLEIVRGVKSA
jgi:hypothetical protein